MGNAWIFPSTFHTMGIAKSILWEETGKMVLILFPPSYRKDLRCEYQQFFQNESNSDSSNFHPMVFHITCEKHESSHEFLIEQENDVKSLLGKEPRTLISKLSPSHESLCSIKFLSYVVLHYLDSTPFDQRSFRSMSKFSKAYLSYKRNLKY